MSESLEKLISLIFKTDRIIKDNIRRRGDFDLFSALRLEVLRYVFDKKNPIMKDVAGYLCIKPPSATALINPLVSAGQIVRIRDKKDRRVIRLVITKKGSENLTRGFKAIRGMMKEALSKLSDKEVQDLTKILQKLSK